jgi:CRISPR-associated protein Cas2
MTNDNARRYVVAYDISDDKRRLRLAKRLLTYGDRIQYSVFVADIKPARFTRLKAVISEIVDRNEDSVLVCDLGLVNTLDSAHFSFIGLERSVTPATSIIL